MTVTYSNIGLQEPSTITNKVAAVSIDRGSTTEQQEILVLGDPQSSLGLAQVVASDPASTAYGLVVRPVGYSTTVQVSSLAGTVLVSPVSTASVRVAQSTAADLQATVTPASTVWAVQAAQGGAWSVRADLSSTSADNPVSAAQSGAWTVRATLSSTAADNPVTVSGYSTTVNVSSLAGIVAVRASDTNWASSAGFHFNSSGELLTAGAAAAGSTQVSVREILTSSGVSVMDSTQAAVRVNVVAGSAASTVVSVSNAVRLANLDTFGRAVVSHATNDIDIKFYEGNPNTLVVVTSTNGGSASANVGGALFASSTHVSGGVQGVTAAKTNYRAGTELFCLFTAAFTAGIANSVMRLGLYDASDGMFLGYEGTAFGVTVRNNAVDTTVASGSWSEDSLIGGAGSQFTRAGTPEAVDFAKLNVFRIRFGWLGSAPVYWEILAPDGHWVTFHKTLFPNLQAVPSIRNPKLPIRLDITKTAAAATDLTIQTDCWAGGISGSLRSILEDEYGFLTTTTLANGATYTSDLLALSPEFTFVETAVLSSHDGDIDIYWYADPAGTDQIRTLSIPYSASSGFQYFAAPAFGPFVKYTFTNDSGSAQTDFYFATKLMRKPVSGQQLRVDGTVLGGMVASVSRSLITAYNGTAYVNVQATNGGNLKMSLQEASDGMDIGAGNAGSETLRVSIASDDVNLSTIRGVITSATPKLKTAAYQSSAADLQATVTPASTVWAVQAAQSGSWTVRANVSSTAADNPVTVSGTVSVSPVSTAMTAVRPASTHAYGQVSISTTAALIAAANTGRQRLLIVQHGGVAVYLGASTVTDTTGLFLSSVAGNQLVLRHDDAVYGITAASTATVSFVEETL